MSESAAIYLIPIVLTAFGLYSLRFIFKDKKQATPDSCDRKLPPSVLEAVEIVNLIGELRTEEDNYVIILCENASCLGASNAVEIGNMWNGLDNGTRFQGNSLVEALRHAASSKKSSTK